MRKTVLWLVLISTVLFAQSSNIGTAIQNLEDTSRSFLAMSVIIQGIIAVVVLGLAAIIYFKKLKGVEKKSTLWVIAAVLLGLIGLLFAVGAILGLIAYLSTPVLIKGLMAD